jgi:cysteine sulfinate desulfinase/cysteine desulfurase-like protein
MGLGADEASSSVRLSLGAGSTEEDVDLALEVVPKAVADLRG